MTKKVTKNHNLLLFTNTENGIKKHEWDYAVKLTSREKWEKPMGHKEVGTPVNIDGDQGVALRHERSQFTTVKLPPHFCPMCEKTNIEPDDRRAYGTIILEENYPEVHMVKGQAISHIVCDDCSEKIAWPDEYDTNLILPRPLRKRSIRVQIRQGCLSYIKSRQLTGQTGTVLGDDTRVERLKDINEEIVK